MVAMARQLHRAHRLQAIAKPIEPPPRHEISYVVYRATHFVPLLIAPALAVAFFASFTPRRGPKPSCETFDVGAIFALTYRQSRIAFALGTPLAGGSA